jgi:hypothetical protein
VARHHAGSQGNGFLHHSLPDSAFGRFDQGPLGAALNIVAVRDNGLTDLCLYLNMEVVPAVAAPYLGEGGPRPQNSCIPGLTAPPQTTVEPQGGRFSPERADSFAEIESRVDPIVVNEHYAMQLRDSGWTSTDQVARDGLIRSTWSFTTRSHPYIATMEFAGQPNGRMTGHIHAEQHPVPPL